MAKAKIDEAPSVPPEAPAVAAADAPFLVRAMLGGTYPDPGQIVARWRNPGDVFLVKCQADMGRWMQRLTADESKDIVAPTKVIPQTTAKTRPARPFPQP